MEFRLCFILSLCLVANGLPKQTKTGVQLRASKNFGATSLTENSHGMRLDSSDDAPSNVHFPVRLINNGVVGGKSGWLEVFISGQWGTVCDDVRSEDGQTYHDEQPDDNVAVVVCRMLGSSGGNVVPQSQTSSYFGANDANPIMMENLICKGTEAEISECRMSWFGSDNDCSHSEDIGINCL